MSEALISAVEFKSSVEEERERKKSVCDDKLDEES